MTFKQLEQFLNKEKWRASANLKTNACGIYARCSYCDQFSDYPCARAFDALMKKRKDGKAPPAAWQHPEPNVEEEFGTLFASEEGGGDSGFSRVSINPEDLFFFNLGGRNAEAYTQAYYEKEAETAVVDAGYNSPIPTYTEESPVPDSTETAVVSTGCTSPIPTYTEESRVEDALAPSTPELLFSAIKEGSTAENNEVHAVTVFTSTAIVPEGMSSGRAIARAMNERVGTRLLVIKRRKKS